MDDWGPILNSLSLDRTLRSISVRSRYQCRKPMDEINSADKARAIGKAPVVLTRYLLEWLTHSIAQCIRNSPALTCLELEGVPLPDDCLAALCVGLSATETLQHLSLKRCYIGDNSCALVCRTIADVPSIRSLNLSQCDLSSYCGPALAAALSRQKLLLYHDTWKDSLRYREPNLDAMPGLRRLTLNDNPHLGDSAVAEVIDVIQDSLWLKALDLQHCGLTDAIGNEILQLLEQNTTLELVDLRSNGNLSEDIVAEVFKRLDFNNTGCRLEYRYFKTTQKDNRSVTAATERREKMKGTLTNMHRPQSAVMRNQKRPCQPNIGRKVPPIALAPKKTKLKPPIPHFPVQNKIKAPPVVVKPAKPIKPLLHLDLQTQIKSTMDDVELQTNEDEESQQYSQAKSVEQLLGHLAQGSEEKLMDERKQMEVQLKEERARREVAEMKLRMMRRDLEDLENVLKAKEIATRGYLLISQKSLDEISNSFEELLKMLENLETDRSAEWRETDLEARETIKRKVTLLLRKTKSEKLGRNTLELESPTKCVKSVGDVSTTVPPHPSQLETQVGDNAEESSTLGNAWRRPGLLQKSSFSPCERARAIFKQLINGNVILNLDHRIS